MGIDYLLASSAPWPFLPLSNLERLLRSSIISSFVNPPRPPFQKPPTFFLDGYPVTSAMSLSMAF